MKLSKSDFIGNYLDKHMKGHGLPYGLAYFNLLERMIEKAEKAYSKQIKKPKT